MMPPPKVVAWLLCLTALSSCVSVSLAGETAQCSGAALSGSAGGAAASACNAADTKGQVLPNWKIGQVHLGGARYRIEMRKNRIAVGGEGEAMSLFASHAESIVTRHGGSGYRIISFAESLDSALPLPQRMAQGVVEIIP